MILLGGSTTVMAQDSSFVTSPPLSESDLQEIRNRQASPHSQVYVRAMRLGDFPTAITALHYLLVEQPQNRYFKDSLAGLYVRTGNAPAAKQLAQEIVIDHPDDNYAQNLLAGIYAQEGNHKGALACFEALEKNTQAPYYTYQVAVMRFQIERYGECKTAIAKLLELPEEQEAFVRIFSDQTEQIIPIQAAALNLRGNLSLQLGQNDAAKEDFEKALEIAPDFLLPKGNLDQMGKR